MSTASRTSTVGRLLAPTTGLLIAFAVSSCASAGSGSAPIQNGTIVPADAPASFGSTTVAPPPRSTTVDLMNPLVSTLVQGNWVLTEVEGKAIGGDSGLSVLPFQFFEDGTYTYSDGCNQNSGTFVVTGSAVEFRRISSTAAACLKVDEVLQANLMLLEERGLEFDEPSTGALTARTRGAQPVTFTFRQPTADAVATPTTS